MSDRTNSEHKAEKIVSKSEKYDNTKYYIENGIDVENRRIMLDEEVDEYSVGWIIRAMRRMIDVNKTDPIDIYINCYGGSVYDGLSLFDFIRACSYTTIRTHVIGKSMSMGAIIGLSGDERYASPRSTFMLHEVSDCGLRERLHQGKTDVKELERLNNVLIDILVDRTKKTKAWWKKELEHEDRYYTKEKALTLGLITDDKFEVM